jgi:hypothetical protein
MARVRFSLWGIFGAAPVPGPGVFGEVGGGVVVAVNDQPYLNVTLEVDDGSRAPYVVSFDAVIPRAAVPQFQPDALIRLKVDPNDPQQVVVDWSGARTMT